MPMTFAARAHASETPSAALPPTGARRLHESLRRGVLGSGALCAALSVAAVAAGPAIAAPPKASATFNGNDEEQTFIVPAGVTSVHVSAIGEGGKRGFGFPVRPELGGEGASVSAQLAVTPGEVLYVEVATPGFNGDGSGSFGGGEGGSASDVRTAPLNAEGSLESRLLVAAGGGGAGGSWFGAQGGNGGDAGGADPATAGGFGVDEGTHVLTAVGGTAATSHKAGAAARACGQAIEWGGDGSLGQGGAGGGAGWLPESGGGGGGGGYYGGGGGEAACNTGGASSGAGGGGGGGSSYASEDVEHASFALTERESAPSVTFTYLTPATATPSTSEITFPTTQPQSTLSPPQTVTLSNEGGNPLMISGETFGASEPALSTDHPEDFLIGSSTCFGAVAFEATCQLQVRFAPQGSGERTATLRIGGNIGEGTRVITLSGTGGALPQGEPGEKGEQGESGEAGEKGDPGEPGATGEKGAQGQAGKAGANGAAGTAGAAGVTGATGPAGEPGKPGAPGPQGERGPRRLTASYLCHPRRRNGKYVNACFVVVPSALKSAVKASLRRGGITYASGTFSRSATGGLTLKANRRVPAGRYTLVLISKTGVSRKIVKVA